MEKEQELTKLVNVLHQTAQVATQSDWNNPQDAANYCVAQYNRILERLKALDATVATIFEPLEEDSSLQVATIACRQLAAYYRDEVDSVYGDSDCGVAFDPTGFRDFLKKGAFDMQGLGEAIRESIQTWAKESKHRSSCSQPKPTDPTE